MTLAGHAEPGRPAPIAIDVLPRLARALARARSRAELVDRSLQGLRDLGLKGFVSEVRGDHVHVIASAIPPTDALVIDRLLGRSFPDLPLPIDTLESLRGTVRQRRATLTRVTAAGLLRAFPRISAAEEAALRHSGDTDVVTAPIEAGDEVLGVLHAWGGRDMAALLPVLETMAAQMGPAWRHLEERVTPESARPLPDAPVHELAAEVDALLVPGALRAALQPVIRLADRTTVAYEALARFTPTARLPGPDELFAAAAACARDDAVNRAALAAGLALAPRVAPATLFLNVSLRHLLEGDLAADLVRLTEAAGMQPHDVVLEVSERDPVPDVSRLRRAAADLRNRGFRIAIDDSGAGHASMLVIAEVRPEFIKVDRSLIHAVHVDAARRALVVSLLSFSGHIGARLIAEGIESERELETLLGLGVQFGQGWHLGRPALVDPPAGVADVVAVPPGWFEQQHHESLPRLVSVPPGAPVRPAPRRGQGADGPREALPHALSHAALALQAEHDPQRILEVMAEQLERVVPVDGLAIYEADLTGHRFMPVHATGDDAEMVLAHSFSLDLGLTGWAFMRGMPERVNNTAAHPAAGQVPGTPVEDESMLLIPLVAGDRKLGMLNCRRIGNDRFTPEDLEAAVLFAHTAAAAWRNAQLYAELSDRAMTDPLTGLLNSRWLRDVGEREVAQARRSEHPLAVLLIDLDHFKRVNDSGGHAAGDLVLQRVAGELRRLIRCGDAAVRLGGEEFLLVLRDADEAGALRVAGALREVLRRVPIPPGCSVGPVTASVGVAVHPAHGRRLEALIRAADLAMYAAKHGGRDRAVVAWPTMTAGHGFGEETDDESAPWRVYPLERRRPDSTTPASSAEDSISSSLTGTEGPGNR